MTTPPKVTLVTCSSMPHLFPGEEGLLDELASRGCDPQIKVWNDPDVDWSDAGMVVVRSVSDYAQDRAAFLEWTRQLRRVQNSADVLNWNTDKHYLRELAALGMPTIPTSWLEPEQNLSKHQIHTRFPAFGEFVVKPAVSSGVRDVGRYTTVDIRQRQAEGIAAAKARGVRFGRPPMPLPENFPAQYQRWKRGEITGKAAAQACGMPLSTFFYRAAGYEEGEPV